MVKYKLVLHHASEEMFLSIAREVEMPALPRVGELVMAGTAEYGEYMDVETIYHYPLAGEIKVECKCPYVWLMVDAWRSGEGWEITECTSPSKDKFLYYLAHPDADIEEPA